MMRGFGGVSVTMRTNETLRRDSPSNLDASALVWEQSWETSSCGVFSLRGDAARW